LPDTDYGTNYRRFTDHLDVILDSVFFNNTDTFAQAYTGDRQFFNIWAGSFGADAEGCSRSFSGDASDVSAVVDGSAIVHVNAFRDCASISAGGSGSVQATETDPAWLLVHESGHFLQALSDEYDGGGYDPAQPCPNVYSNQSSCQAAALGVGATAAQCSQIGSTGIWRIVTANETMTDRLLASDFHDDSDRCVTNRFSSCYAGSCY
jgi:hypothetical protein